MSPQANTQTAPRPVFNGTAAAGPSPMPAPNLVTDIPVHNPSAAAPPRDEDAELDKIMRDVGQELKKDEPDHKSHHFLSLKRGHKKEANFSTQMSIKDVHHAPVPAPAATAAPRPAVPAKQSQAPAAAKPALSAKAPAIPKQPKGSGAPVGVTLVTIIVTGALIAAAYYAYK